MGSALRSRLTPPPLQPTTASTHHRRPRCPVPAVFLEKSDYTGWINGER
jgi:hypothetical protein